MEPAIITLIAIPFALAFMVYVLPKMAKAVLIIMHTTSSVFTTRMEDIEKENELIDDGDYLFMQ